MSAMPARDLSVTARGRARHVVAPLPRKVALYLRVSSKQQDEEDKTSLKTQEQECRAAALADKLLVDEAHVYREVCTAEDYYERPVLLSLRRAVAQGTIGIVLVHCVDRLSRDPNHLLIALTELERAGAEVRFAIDSLEDTPEGKLVAYIKGYAAQMENRMRKERSLRAKKERVAGGRPLPSNRPLYGYRWGPETIKEGKNQGKLTKECLIEDPITAPIVRRIYRDAASGKSLRAIAAALTAEGIATPATYAGQKNGAAYWDPGVVRKILNHSTYWGEPRALTTQCVPLTPQERLNGGYKHRTVRRTVPGVALPETVAPALVSRALAQQVQDRLQVNWQLASRNYRRPETTLLHGGLARCAYCGGAMTITGTSKTLADGSSAAIYICRKVLKAKGACVPVSITCHLLDSAVWEKMRLLLLNPQLIADEIERANAHPDQDPTQRALDAIEAKIAELTRRIDNKRKYAELIDDDRERETTAEEVKALLTQRRGLEDQRETATLHAEHAGAQAQALKNVMEWAARWGRNVDDMTMHERRYVLAALRAYVQVWQVKDRDPRIKLNLRLPISGELPVVPEPGGAASVCVTTVTGKVQKYLMREQAIVELGLGAAATAPTA